MPKAKIPPLTPEEKARAERARAKQKAAKDEEKQILSAARKRVKTEDSYRKVLVGAAVLDEAEKNPAYKAELVRLLARFFTTERQRQALEVLGVPPLAPRPASTDMRPEAPAEIAAMPVQGFGEPAVRMVRH